MNSIEKAAMDKANKIKSKPFFEDSKYNPFTDYIYRLYYACYIDKPDMYKTTFKTIIANTKKYYILNQIQNLIMNLANQSPDFETLYDFSSFIKYMEKVFFLKNDDKLYICCDSQLEERNTRVLIFQGVDVKVKLTLHLNNKSIDLEISRAFGRNMNNSYKIIDRNIDFDGKSDEVLVYNIILTMQSMMANFYLDIVKCVANDFPSISSIELEFWEINLKEFNIFKYIKEYYQEYYGEIRGSYTKAYKDIQYLIKKKYFLPNDSSVI